MVGFGFDTATVITTDGSDIVEVHRYETSSRVRSARSHRCSRAEPSGTHHAVGLGFILGLLAVLASL